MLMSRGGNEPIHGIEIEVLIGPAVELAILENALA